MHRLPYDADLAPPYIALPSPDGDQMELGRHPYGDDVVVRVTAYHEAGMVITSVRLSLEKARLFHAALGTILGDPCSKNDSPAGSSTDTASSSTPPYTPSSPSLFGAP